jgi:Dyp-type peroxidase family
MAQITEIFEALLSREGLRVSNNGWGRIFRVAVLAPLAAGADLSAWREEIDKLGVPPESDIKAAFMKTEVVHFASLNAIDLGETGAPAPYLLLEVNGDGDAEALIDAIDVCAGEWLLPLFASAAIGDNIPGAARYGQSLGKLLRASALDLQARPWGTTGLCFYGLPGQSAARIAQQAKLAQFCRAAVDYFVSIHAGFGSHAAEVLKFVRGLIHGDPKLKAMATGDDEIGRLLKEGQKFRSDLMIPSRQQPETMAWKEPDSRVFAVISSRTLYPVYRRLTLVAIIVSALCFHWLGFSLSFAWRDIATTLGQSAIALVAGCFGAVTLVGIIVAGFAARLYWADISDKPEDLDPDLARVREIAKRENIPNCAQNHFLSVSPLKPGAFRKFTLGLALWGIELVVARAFRPGFVVNMGTIHFARWFRPPGSERLVFLSNYDGSWESYLEDFITKAYPGQNAAWSNAIGFPRTEWLVNGGAQDGDRFKRWVRRQQVPTQFWFNRFPELTADQIRNNAVICWELARASTDSQARAWLSYFGSMPKTDTEIETQEVQAIVFRGLKRLPHMKFAAIRLPEDRGVCAAWLKSLAPYDPSAMLEHGPLEVTFGDRPLSGDEERSATFVALTASGLLHLGLSATGDVGGVATFPTAFNLGMSSRRSVLGDDDSKWRWSDADGAPIHAAVLLYAKTKEKCDELFEKHGAELQGAAVAVYEPDTQPTTQCGINYEHFGFRDGISQPVIRGTQRFARGAQPRDIMEPGEFILGYKSNQGYYPPTPVVARESDVKNRLGSVPISAETRFSAFQDPRPQVRDFGRNGCFLAIRQFEQHVKNFHDYAAECAKQLQGVMRLPDLIGGAVTAEWVEAKMMGRWHDGVPLIDRPIAHHAAETHRGGERHATEAEDKKANAHACRSAAKTADQSGSRFRSDTDLDFGVDDPQGLYCPFGAHIRRVNPRGSLAPGDNSQLTITNRHRLLRRGRSYQQGAEKGLLFIGLCADIERQFEFIQQSWLNAPGFAGLTSEPDPIVAVKPGGSLTRFTIPTSAGSLSLKGGESFVTIHGGGYFFLPSRSALMFLADLNQRSSAGDRPASQVSA